jgi:hypothetical protein
LNGTQEESTGGQEETAAFAGDPEKSQRKKLRERFVQLFDFLG